MNKKLLSAVIFAAIFLSASAQQKSESGSWSSVSGSALESYPSLDLLNSFTGVVPGIYQTENFGRTGVRYNALNASLKLRGFSNPVFIVDGVIIGDESELQISPEEIDSVFVISDILDKLKYGPEVAQGAIYIKTLRGLKNARQSRVGFESGVDVVDRFPEWVSNGFDYATINNAARIVAGYPKAFTDFAMNRLKADNNMDQAFPSVDYRSLMFKNTRPYNKAFAVIRGGGQDIRYSANLAYHGQGDIYAVGATSDYSRFNAKMNMDIRISDKMRADFNFIGIYGIRRSPLGAYGETDNVSEFASIWERARKTPPVEYPLLLGRDEATGTNIYPVSTAYPDHPYGSLAESGAYKEATRTGITDLAVHYDLSSLLKGLSSESQVGYNVLYMTRIGQGSDYMGFNIDSETWSTASSTHKGQSESEESYYKTFYLQGIQFIQRIKYLHSFGNNLVGANVTYFRSREVGGLYTGYHNQQYFALDGKYSYGGKYSLEFVLNYAGTTSLPKDNRYALFPAVGLAWDISKEPFIKKIKAINILKIRAQAGVTGNEIYGDQFYWQSRYYKSADMTFGPYSIGQWFGSNIYTTKNATMARQANPDLDWERLHEVTAGFDAVLWNSLQLSATYYNTLRDGVVTDISSSLPSYCGITTKYDNYNAYRHSGVDLSLSYKGKSGNLSYKLGANALLPRSIVEKYCETVVHENLNRVGKSSSAIFGYDCIGRFGSEAEINNSPVQTFDSEVYYGDLKYRDITGDGIVDVNDRTVIGDSAPKLLYSVNLFLSWKKWDLNIIGTGKAFYDVMLSNVYYWNGWGDGNYSAFVRDNLNTNRYPRLSYLQSQNNFRASQYWMRDGSFFKVQCVELGYTLKHIRLFAKAANLLTISGIEDCDPESLSSGVTDYPLFRTYTCGIKFMF